MTSSPFSCYICGHSNCRTYCDNFSKALSFSDNNLLDHFVNLFPQTKEVLHYECRKCTDGYIGLAFQSNNNVVYALGHYDGKTYTVTDSNGNIVPVSVRKVGKKVVEKKGLMAAHAVCGRCCFDIEVSYFKKTEETTEFDDIDEDEMSSLWEDFKKYDPSSLCIKCDVRKKNKALICDHCSQRVREEDLAKFYEESGYKVEVVENKNGQDSKYGFAYKDSIIYYVKGGDAQNYGNDFFSHTVYQCSYILTRGKNKGKKCGRRAINSEYCTLHYDKRI